MTDGKNLFVGSDPTLEVVPIEHRALGIERLRVEKRNQSRVRLGVGKAKTRQRKLHERKGGRSDATLDHFATGHVGIHESMVEE